MREITIFWLLGKILLYFLVFSKDFGVRGRAINTWCGQQSKNKGCATFFGKTGGRIGIILEDNPAGHFFVLNNLIPMKIFKWVMIVKLKMCPVRKIVDKICLIATRYILFPICGLRLGEGRCETLRKAEGLNFGSGWHSTEERDSKFCAWGGSSPL